MTIQDIEMLIDNHIFSEEPIMGSINADKKYIDEKGAFDISKCDLIAYSNGHYYALGKKLEKFGFSVQKNKKKDPIVINKIYKYYHYSHKMRLSL